MFCSKCGFQIPDNAAFCPKCGNPVSKQSNVSKAARAAGNSGKMIPAIIIAATVVVLFLVFLVIRPFSQTGGAKSYGQLIETFLAAYNDGDIETCLNTFPVNIQEYSMIPAGLDKEEYIAQIEEQEQENSVFFGTGRPYTYSINENEIYYVSDSELDQLNGNIQESAFDFTIEDAMSVPVSLTIYDENSSPQNYTLNFGIGKTSGNWYILEIPSLP